MTAMTSQQAAEIAREAHAGQTDKAGHDYFDAHVEPVAMMVKQVGAPDMLVAVAYLHDVVEDTTMGFGDLTRHGLSNDQRGTLIAVTKRDGETYDSYLKRLAATGGPDAITLKACDMASNGDRDRMEQLDDATARRLHAKYARGVETLSHLLDSWYGDPGRIEHVAHDAIRIAQETCAPSTP